jgi:predicted transposase/invertase (TIGR01784 family)
MFDNVCKYLAETFSEDYAAWLLGKPVTLTTLSPKELSLEPIRADSLILEQSDDLVLHLEFQTEPDESMGFRMLDYRVRVHRRGLTPGHRGNKDNNAPRNDGAVEVGKFIVNSHLNRLRR